MTSRRTWLRMLVGSLALGPANAAAQRAGRTPRIGFLWDTPAVWPHALEGFRQGLRDLGWIDGKNITVEYRWAEGHFERLPAIVDELLRLKVDLIVAPTSIYTGAARRATSTIPIVFASHADPIGSGHVVSLARPGTNATGLTIMMSDTTPKSLELLKSVVPALGRVAVIWDPATPSHTPALNAAETAGRTLALHVQAVAVRSAAEFESAFSAIVREHAGAALVLSTPLYIGGTRQLADIALRHKVPTLFGSREHVDAGGLLSYSPDRADLYRRAASYVDKILKGTNPADLPVQQATRFELAINMKTARGLGLTIPQSVLARADQIIE